MQQIEVIQFKTKKWFYTDVPLAFQGKMQFRISKRERNRVEIIFERNGQRISPIMVFPDTGYYEFLEMFQLGFVEGFRYASVRANQSFL